MQKSENGTERQRYRRQRERKEKYRAKPATGITTLTDNRHRGGLDNCCKKMSHCHTQLWRAEQIPFAFRHVFTHQSTQWNIFLCWALKSKLYYRGYHVTQDRKNTREPDTACIWLISWMAGLQMKPSKEELSTFFLQWQHSPYVHLSGSLPQSSKNHWNMASFLFSVKASRNKWMQIYVCLWSVPAALWSHEGR